MQKLIAFLFAAIFLSSPAMAQSGGLDEIIVTGSRKVDAPAIYIEHPGV